MDLTKLKYGTAMELIDFTLLWHQHLDAERACRCCTAPATWALFLFSLFCTPPSIRFCSSHQLSLLLALPLPCPSRSCISLHVIPSCLQHVLIATHVHVRVFL
jgi:hypothetical protein